MTFSRGNYYTFQSPDDGMWYVKHESGLDYGRFFSRLDAKKVVRGLARKDTDAAQTAVADSVSEVEQPLKPAEDPKKWSAWRSQFFFTVPDNKSEEDKMCYHNKTAVAAASVVNVPMYDATAEAVKRLQSRGADVYYKKTEEFRTQFGLVDNDRPRTPTELVERIKKGLFVLPKDVDEMDFTFDSVRDLVEYLRWRDPSVKEDKEGFKAAVAKLEAAYNELMDEIVLGTVEKARELLKKFEQFKV